MVGQEGYGLVLNVNFGLLLSAIRFGHQKALAAGASDVLSRVIND
jgi:hypothetical protein